MNEYYIHVKIQSMTREFGSVYRRLDFINIDLSINLTDLSI